MTKTPAPHSSPPPQPSPASRPTATDALRAGVRREDGALPADEAGLQALIDAAMTATGRATATAPSAGTAGTVETTGGTAGTDQDGTPAESTPEGFLFVPSAADRRLLKLLRKDLTRRERKVDAHTLLRAGLRVIASLDRETLGVVLDGLAAPATSPAPKKSKDKKQAKAGKKNKEDKGKHKERT